MPVYRLNCVSESFFESMYFIHRLCRIFLRFFGTNNRQNGDHFLIYERGLLESLIKKHLKNFSFDDGNSLLECDFLDTYSNNIAEYVDPYPKWQTVPIFYLIKYSYGINYLSPISYKFYIQSLMWNYVKNRDIFIKEINGLEQWFHSLFPLNEDYCIDNEKFTKLTDISLIEGRVISYFLFCIYHDSLISNEIKILVKDINNLFWMSWKYNFN